MTPEIEVTEVSLGDIDLLDVGNAIGLAGAIYTGQGKTMLVPFPGMTIHVDAVTYSFVSVTNGSPSVTIDWDISVLRMTGAEWERFLHQSDVLDVRGPAKAILRKSQRQIDNRIAWEVFRRDGFLCRYCGRQEPLTVDHVIVWEAGGATVADNLISSCGKCNRTRGTMDYDVWIDSSEYSRVSRALTEQQRTRNRAVVAKLEELKSIVVKPRSR